MFLAPFKLQDDYWETFELNNQDLEFLYNYLLESETPLSNEELLSLLIAERITHEQKKQEEQQSLNCVVYLPKETYTINQRLAFPSLGWRKGEVTKVREGNNHDIGKFDVIDVKFEHGETREFAAALIDHALNNPPVIDEVDQSLTAQHIIADYGEELVQRLEDGLAEKSGFVKIAGKWFPKALLVDLHIGHLNLVEAVLDMAGGGPLPSQKLLEQLDLGSNVNPKLLEFSLNYALQEDARFDEVGSAGDVQWFLQRLEPEPVLQPPLYLRYHSQEYDRSVLTPDMLKLERSLQDELSIIDGKPPVVDEVELSLIFPHWRVGTLPLSMSTHSLFPTAYEAPRIRFTIVDGETGEKFPAWVVRSKGYVFGLKEWYDKRGLIPGSLIKIQRSKNRGEVVLRRDIRRSGREWIRTLLVGSDGGIVFAMLKQNVTSSYDDRMAIAIPDVEALDQIWEKTNKERIPFEKVVVDAVRELTKLNPQSHVHISELYAAVNLTRRCPPGPIMGLIASRPWFTHVGDLHYRFSDTERG